MAVPLGKSAGSETKLALIETLRSWRALENVGMFKRNLSACLFLVALGISACAAPPQQLIDQARQAMEDAKASGAERYATDAMNTAMESFNTAEAEIAAQGKKFAASRNYKVAMEKFQEAMAAFEQAKMDATSAKDAMKVEVDGIMTETTTLVDAVEQKLAKVVASKPKMDLTAWQNDVAGLRQAMTDAGAAVTAEDYVTAKSKIESARAKSMEISALLDQQLAKNAGR